MRISITTSVLVGAAVLATASTAAAKNYLVIILDDAAVDKIGSYAGDYAGYAPAYLPDTATIDSLATAGLRFTRAWATPMCSSTRVAFQAGQQPYKTGIGVALPDDHAGVNPATLTTTIASAFVTGGHDTGMFGKWHLGTEDAAGVTGYPAASPFVVQPHPARMGWQRFFGSFDGYLGNNPAIPGNGYFAWERVGWVTASGTGYAAVESSVPPLHATDRTVDVALDWITGRGADPWLAVVALNAPHAGTGASTGWDYADVDATQFRTPALACLATSSCADDTKAIYQGLVEHADLQIEALLDGIAALSAGAILDDTLIVVFGDNGTPRGAFNFRVQESVFDQANRGKGSTYENGVRVPLIIADGAAWRTGLPGPTIPVIGRDVDARVNTLDLLNTLHGDAFGTLIAGIDSSDFGQCFTTNDRFCNFPAVRYSYTETFALNGLPNGAQVSVGRGWDTMYACYNVANACMKESFYDSQVDPLQTAPQAWVGARANQLRNYFTNLHAAGVSWANPTGAAVIPFCGAAVPACP